MSERCADARVAFFSICIGESDLLLQNCLASLCSLLVTTDPACVIVVVSRWIYEVAARVLVANGVQPVIAPEWLPLPVDHPYARLTDHEYSFAALEAFRLAQHDKIITFDVDILFIRNASGLGELESFAASRFDEVVNTGVTVLRPSPHVYNEVIRTWRRGEYELQFSKEHNLHQDVVHEVCVNRGLCGSSVTELDACVFNHGGWMPARYPRTCNESRIVARHNFYAKREPFLSNMLETTMRRGRCRPRAGPISSLLDYRDSDCWHGQYTEASCCHGGRGRTQGGHPGCWDGRITFERCCVGVDDAAQLRQELLPRGQAWYGLSSIPTNVPPTFFGDLCLRQFERSRLTLTSKGGTPFLDRSPGYWSHWQNGGLPQEIIHVGRLCMSLGYTELNVAPPVFLLFRFRFERYFRRNADDPTTASIYQSYAASPTIKRHLETQTACVPRECCHYQPLGSESSIWALRTLLWNHIAEFNLNVRPDEVLPAPLPSDFEAIYAVNADKPSEWYTCERPS
eukprot:TRINITY_DN69807_c0_g1_i1.p1 TRINITY_DN69807_c0_g1~~TRINITY_DN69807_c0_g1_i1.p1  ORF type:complete len:513 (+),score=39.65 TRINITY_DN69807_c0_g1_i1:34-1572(+)